MRQWNRYCIFLILQMIFVPCALGEEWTADRIKDFSQNIPIEIQEMSNVDVVASLLEGKVGAKDSIRLRLLTQDSVSRKSLCDALVRVAIESKLARPVISLLSTTHLFEPDAETRDDIVASIIEIMETISNSILLSNCHSALGDLNGEMAIRRLKSVLLESSDEFWADYGTKMQLGTVLVGTMKRLGPEAVPILLEGIEDVDDPYKLKENPYMLRTVYDIVGACANEDYLPVLLEKFRAAGAKEARAADAWDARLAREEQKQFLRSTLQAAEWYSLESRELILDAALEEVDSDDHELRWIVIDCLEKIGDERHVGLLERIAANDPYYAPHAGDIVVPKGLSQEEERRFFAEARKNLFTTMTYALRDRTRNAISAIEARMAEEKEER